MRYASPALNTLAVAVETECKHEGLKKYRKKALEFLDSLDRLVNPTATINEEQAFSLSDWLVDKHLPKNPDYPALQERLPLATYINSCRA